MLAARVPNSMGLYYTWKESLWNKLSFGIKIVLVYRRTHSIQSDNVGVFCLSVSWACNNCNWRPFCLTWYILYHLNWTHVSSKMACSIPYLSILKPGSNARRGSNIRRVVQQNEWNKYLGLFKRRVPKLLI